MNLSSIEKILPQQRQCSWHRTDQ